MDADFAAKIGSIGATTSWYNTKDRSARTLPGRTALLRSFEEQARRDFPDAGDEEIATKVTYLRKIFYKRIALASVKARTSRRTKKGSAVPAEPSQEVPRGSSTQSSVG